MNFARVKVILKGVGGVINKNVKSKARVNNVILKENDVILSKKMCGCLISL